MLSPPNQIGCALARIPLKIPPPKMAGINAVKNNTQIQIPAIYFNFQQISQKSAQIFIRHTPFTASKQEIHGMIPNCATLRKTEQPIIARLCSKITTPPLIFKINLSKIYIAMQIRKLYHLKKLIKQTKQINSEQKQRILPQQNEPELQRIK